MLLSIENAVSSKPAPVDHTTLGLLIKPYEVTVNSKMQNPDLS
tara:strand:- start:919 stop:1047 length:129 start_codon:yes stop_codon:yes gene_type:complete